MWRGGGGGPGGSPYQGGYYVLAVEYPPTYPTHPPKVAFQTPVVHPTIGRARSAMQIRTEEKKGVGRRGGGLC